MINLKRPAYMGMAMALAVMGAVTALAQDNAKTAEDFVTTARIETIFLMNGDLNPFKINTTTKGGVVIMTGVVREQADKDLAGRLAKSVKGVTSVNNELTVDRSAPVVEENREWRTQVDDANLNARIHRRLAYNASLKDTMVNVDVTGSKVVVSGTVESEAKKNEIVRIIDDTSGVAAVESNLEVKAPGETKPVKETTDDAIQTVSDEWVEKMVESSIMWDDNISIRNIDVEVDGGVCKLSGSVISEAQKSVAENIAKNTDGVKSVTNNIEVV
ncbi:MAG: BON domain-containing protein [Candidatus Hydrogenedentes bacterium]|nr:BON domain-containing protein [Candidatus Hydrogenedentota bacterium]